MPHGVTSRQLAGYQDFFPEIKPYCKEYYACQIGKDTLLTFICHFLGHFRQPLPSNRDFIREFFKDDNPAYDVYLKAYISIKEADIIYSLLNVESLLRLYQWTIKAQIPDDVEQSPEWMMEIEEPLFTLFLLFNDDVKEDYQYAIDCIKESGEVFSPQKLFFAMSFPQHDLVNADYAQLVYSQLYKAMELLRFMARNEEYKLLYKAMLSYFECINTEDFVRSMYAAVVEIISANKGGYVILAPAPGEDFEKNCDFIEKLVIQDSALFVQDDFLEIRNTPFRKLKRGEYMIIYDLFMVKKAYNSLYFKLLDLSETDKGLFKKSFAGSYKTDFSESTLVYDVVSKIFPDSKDIKISGDEFKTKKIKTEPDYYVRTNDNKQLLFESKDFYVAGNIKASYDFRRIEPELKKRLFKEVFDDGHIKNGAVRQLVINVQRSLDNGFILDENYDYKTIEIYPIILVHDALYSASGLNFEVNQWFNLEIESLRCNSNYAWFNFDQVLPVTVVEIDTLILFRDNLATAADSLDNLIRKYHTYTRMNYSELNTEEYVNKSVVSFSMFARQHFSSKGIKPNIPIITEMFRQFEIK